MAQITVITQLRERNHCNPNSLVIYAHMSIPWVISVHTHTHTQSEWVLPAPLRVWGWCLSSATRTISILIALTPRTASTHTRPLLPYVPSLPSSIPHSFSPPVLSSKCLSLTICILLLPVTHWLYTGASMHIHTHTHLHSQASKCPFLHMLLLIAPLPVHR